MTQTLALTDAEWDDLRSENMYDTEEGVRQYVDRLLAARVAAALAPARALADMWDAEAAERGREDRIYTSGAAGMLNDALNEGEKR